MTPAPLLAHAFPRRLPPVVAAVRTLLWIQFGCSFGQCWLLVLPGYAVTSGSAHAGDPPGTTSWYLTGMLVYALALVAAAPQLAVQAVRTADRPGPGLYRWTLAVLAGPPVVLGVLAVAAAASDHVLAASALGSAVFMGAVYLPVPVAAAVGMATTGARAWYRTGPLRTPAVRR
ncbi:hypothetical protein [Glycomyces paridis]|uniref:Uncharacterized protein n=1 Tax=Glycomyces paridis TaxID=2126555 RepID=A0A4S8PAR6_9ACTN|nr:hypothetical protein [Glycomyces paridis]THV26232.1 hypothetical protein E9998_19245 [Glycomyces paridis]